jgi:hypothetical protein
MAQAITLLDGESRVIRFYDHEERKEREEKKEFKKKMIRPLTSW